MVVKFIRRCWQYMTGRHEPSIDPAIPLTQAVGRVSDALLNLESQILQKVAGNLILRGEGRWSDTDDDLFALHTAYCSESWQCGLPQRSAVLWEQHISPLVRKADEKLSRKTAPDRIHKGAPLYNVGVSHFLSGNLDRAMQFISEAGVEEAELGRSGGSGIQIGLNQLSDQVLIAPIVRGIDATANWQADYKSITGCDLDKAELKNIVKWLSTRLVNALQFVISLRRFFLVNEGPENSATQHIRVQVLADVVLVVESSMREWQTAVSGQLHNRMSVAAFNHTPVKTSFDAAHDRFCAQYPGTDPNREKAIAVNWAVNDALSEFTCSSNAAQRAGIAAYLAVRLRNSLMHVIDDGLDLYSSKIKCEQVCGLMVAVIRLSQHGNQNTLTTL